MSNNKVSTSLVSQLLPSYAVEATFYFSVVKSTVPSWILFLIGNKISVCTVYDYHWLLTETIESYLIATACITQIVLSLALQRKCHEMTERGYEIVWSATMLLLYCHFKQALQIVIFIYMGKWKEQR